MKPVRSAARALLGGIFVASGARTVANPEPFVTRAKAVTDRVGPLAERLNPRLPTDAAAMVRANGAVQLVAGLMLITGRFPRPAAAALAGTMVPTTLAGHRFWEADDPTERIHHQTQFMKNLALVGGLLLAAADTEGRPSLRWRTSHAVRNRRRSVQRVVRSARRDARIAVRAANTARRLPG
jgi:putative oxidoreductase